MAHRWVHPQVDDHYARPGPVSVCSKCGEEWRYNHRDPRPAGGSGYKVTVSEYRRPFGEWAESGKPPPCIDSWKPERRYTLAEIGRAVVGATLDHFVKTGEPVPQEVLADEVARFLREGR